MARKVEDTMRFLVPLAAVALSACVTVYPPDEPAAEAVAYAHFNETATVGPARVTPLTLVEDSRCPTGVQCVWAGRVRITARIDGAAREMTLGQPVTLDHGALTLVEVRPVRVADVAPRPADYVFGFRFAR
ncbi:MAG TPA: hypothetical protein VM055_08470 [Novosphingobium sp.]|nr:hypothetical protein [Novosphingobium sp.]